MKKQIIYFLFIYAALRAFSYFFQPDTPLHGANLVNSIVAAIILIIAIYFLLKKDERGWYIVAGEIILGGAGGFLALVGIALRTWLLITSLLIYFGQKIKGKNLDIITSNKYISGFLLLILLTVGWGFARGLAGGHAIGAIIADTIPYLFFLYYFPLHELIALEKFKSFALNALIAAVIGNFIFIAITFIGFSSGLFILQDQYYHWFRDVALGKITELPFHFYRLVLNEHLLLVPILLFFISKLIKKINNYFVPGLLLLGVLAVNLTRVYLLALIVGLLFLFSKQYWKRWLLVTLGTLAGFVLLFTIIHFSASRGTSLGWEIFGLRVQSIVSPSLEDSSLSRMLLLPKILDKIQLHPILGNGLGDTVTVYSPVLKQTITTPHFDWGYLEIWDELGFIGLAAWLCLIIYSIFKIQYSNRWLLAALMAILVINLTSPALFHVLGIIWLTYLICVQILADN